MACRQSVQALPGALLGFCVLVSAVSADVTKIYRCGEAGKYNFSSEPCGKNAKPVDIETTHLSTDPNPYTKIIDEYRQDLKQRELDKKKIKK